MNTHPAHCASDEAFRAMIVAALWSSVDSEGNPMDDTFDFMDVAAATVLSLREDLDDFVDSNLALITASGLSDEQVGHDFWLTRNGHGAGFWDRGLGKVGDLLTAACKPYGAVDLYVGDDGLVHA